MKENKTFPFWHFLVRGAAHTGWTIMCIMLYFAFPYPIFGVSSVLVSMYGHYRLISLFDYIFEDEEDGEDE